jgi:hypothetical protein
VCDAEEQNRENFHVIYANLCIKETEIGQDEITEISTEREGGWVMGNSLVPSPETSPSSQLFFIAFLSLLLLLFFDGESN